MSTSTPSPSTSTSTFRLYYPPGMLGRAEPIRLILLELGLQWEEPWASSPSLHSIDGCLAELERMRREMPQPVFGMPILEHRMGGGGGGGGGGVGERKEEGKAGEGEVFWLGQTPVIAHYLATVEGTGRLLPKGGVREGHRACQLAADIEDATAEAYHAWRLLSKAKGYVSEQAVKEVEGTQRWWTEKRLPAWAAHFEKALTTGHSGAAHLHHPAHRSSIPNLPSLSPASLSL